MVFSIIEIIKIVIGTLVDAFILKDYFKLPIEKTHRFNSYSESYYRDIKSISDPYQLKLIGYTFLILIPSIGLHEIGHKLMGLALGFSAIIDISTQGLFMSLLFKFAFGFTFIVPAFVVTSGVFTYLDNFLISVSGPLLNLIIWKLCQYLLFSKMKLKHSAQITIGNIGRINKFLFFFNIIPLPFFDGWGIWSSLFYMIMGVFNG